MTDAYDSALELAGELLGLRSTPIKSPPPSSPSSSGRGSKRSSWRIGRPAPCA